MSTSRRLSGLGPRATHPPATMRSIDRLNVDEFALIRSARLPIRSGPALVRTTRTRKCGSVMNSSAGETERATTPSSARDAVRIASVVCARRPEDSFTTLLSGDARYLVGCRHATFATVHGARIRDAETATSNKLRHSRPWTLIRRGHCHHRPLLRSASSRPPRGPSQEPATGEFEVIQGMSFHASRRSVHWCNTCGYTKVSGTFPDARVSVTELIFVRPDASHPAACYRYKCTYATVASIQKVM